MDTLKQLMRQRLVASVIADKLKTHENILFEEAWCSVERTLRFTTDFFRQLLPPLQAGKGKWKTGDFVMFEAKNGADALVINCVLATKGLNAKQMPVADKLSKAAGAIPSGSDILLKSWNFSDLPDDNALFAAVDDFLRKTLPAFQQELWLALEKSAEPDSVAADYGEGDDVLEEGSQTLVKLTKYERSKKARAKCLEHYGTACKVCGFDFAKMFGSEFAGKIEVHHIIPLSEIKENYVVDPIQDLVPVCPNCHLALHSKKGGVYTVEELKQLRNKEQSP